VGVQQKQNSVARNAVTNTIMQTGQQNRDKKNIRKDKLYPAIRSGTLKTATQTHTEQNTD
jgi:hypothetical protein